MGFGWGISIHTPHAGSDSDCHSLLSWFIRFQSTLPMRGATRFHNRFSSDPKISIHTPHAGSDLTFCGRLTFLFISIHTPHAGSDITCVRPCLPTIDFNPHSPCGERLEPTSAGLQDEKFQSTLPMRGATSSGAGKSRAFHNFNPHSPCGERHGPFSLVSFHFEISIHTPHAGSDNIHDFEGDDEAYFNPHSPCGERRH